MSRLSSAKGHAQKASFKSITVHQVTWNLAEDSVRIGGNKVSCWTIWLMARRSCTSEYDPSDFFTDTIGVLYGDIQGSNNLS